MEPLNNALALLFTIRNWAEMLSAPGKISVSRIPDIISPLSIDLQSKFTIRDFISLFLHNFISMGWPICAWSLSARYPISAHVKLSFALPRQADL